MWTTLETPANVCKVEDRVQFVSGLQQYMRKDRGLIGMLQYIPSGTLVRVHIDEDSLNVLALKPPADTSLFEVGQLHSLVGPNLRQETCGPRTVELYQTREAMVYFYTVEDHSVIARQNTTRMLVLDQVVIRDFIDTKSFALSARYPIRTADKAALLGRKLIDC